MKLSDFHSTEDDQRIQDRLERLKARTGLTDQDLDALVAKAVADLPQPDAEN
jgi:hypothetical protein